MTHKIILALIISMAFVLPSAMALATIFDIERRKRYPAHKPIATPRMLLTLTAVYIVLCTMYLIYMLINSATVKAALMGVS